MSPRNSKFSTNSNLVNLPHFLLDLILDYLSPYSIFFSLGLTCKTLQKYLNSSDYIRQQSQKHCLGLSKNFKLPINFDFHSLWSNLSNKKITHDLPFYGYFTDGGMDENNTEYWVNRVFQRGNWSICSRSGKNFHIIGGLIKGKDFILDKTHIYSEILKVTEPLVHPKQWYDKFFQCFKRRPSLLDQMMNERLFQMIFFIDRKKIQDFFLMNMTIWKSNAILKQLDPDDIMKKLDDFHEQSHLPLEKLDFTNNFIVKEKNIVYDEYKLAIIKGIDFSRQGFFTCPVNCLMIFISEEFLEYNEDKEFRLFDGCDGWMCLRQKLFQYDLIHKIKSTNIPDLWEYSDLKKDESEQFQFVLFQNNINRKDFGKFKPMIWLKINEPNFDYLTLDFPRTNCFSGKSVMLKLLECDKKEPWINDYNIDINFLVFLGEILNLQEQSNHLINKL